MGDVTFLGLGPMGSALAATAIDAGFDTVVWNRSESRAGSLVDRGARYLAAPGDAISQSPVSVVCVRDYAASDAVLRTAAASAALTGRTLVQLTTGSPQSARSSQQWCHEVGGRYLDGAIMAAPSQIGGPECLFLVAGDEDGLDAAGPLLRALAPRLDYLGEDAGRASALDSALLSGSLGLFMGVLNGAALCEAAGVPVDRYASYLPGMDQDIKAAMDSLRKIVEDRLTQTEAPLEVWAATTEAMIETAEQAGYSAEIPTFVKQLLGRAMERGLGRHSIGALIEVLRPERK